MLGWSGVILIQMRAIVLVLDFCVDNWQRLDHSLTVWWCVFVCILDDSSIVHESKFQMCRCSNHSIRSISRFQSIPQKPFVRKCIVGRRLLPPMTRDLFEGKRRSSQGQRWEEGCCYRSRVICSTAGDVRLVGGGGRTIRKDVQQGLRTKVAGPRKLPPQSILVVVVTFATTLLTTSENSGGLEDYFRLARDLPSRTCCCCCFSGTLMPNLNCRSLLHGFHGDCVPNRVPSNSFIPLGTLQ